MKTVDLCDRSILIVDDDRDVRQALSEVLEDNDFHAVPAENGAVALDRLRHAPAKPCAILLDIMMPVMDGLEFRAVQRNDPELKEIPVVVLTAHANPSQTAAEVGADAYLRKPIKLDQLMATIERLC